MNDPILPALDSDDNEKSLSWHALNYRTAHTIHAQAMYEELDRYVEAVLNDAYAIGRKESLSALEMTHWQPIDAAPAGRVVLLAAQSGDERRTFVAEISIGDRETYWMVTHGWHGWSRLRDGWTPTHWMPLPIAPCGID